MLTKESVFEQLDEVEDPELELSIVELGLVYDVRFEEKEEGVHAEVDLTLTSPGCPHANVDFEDFGADFMAFSAHKMCGPTGIGALLVTQDVFDEMEQFMGGGDMIETVTIEGSTYQSNEHKFEAGTPRIAEAIGWTAALEWMETFDLEAEHTRLIKIASWVADQLRDLGMDVYGRHGEHDAAVVSFLHPTINSEDMAHLLDARGFAVRTGHHCAQPLLTRLGISGTVRASFYVYNTREEAESFVDELRIIVEKFS